MAANTLSVYCPSPLYERSRAAEAEGKFKIKDVCNEALQKALDDLDAPPVTPSGLILPSSNGDAPEPAPDLSTLDGAAELAQQASELEYQPSFSNDLPTAQAFLDHIADQGGWPISMWRELDGRYGMLIAWPKVLTAVSK
jgi:hypothetical protein